MATYGSSNAPSQVTTNLDSLFSLSLAAYRKELVDQVSASNAFLYELMKKDFYEGQDGGTYIQVPLLYGLQNADTYDGYDELPTVPVDGVTSGTWDWRQVAAAVVYSMKEVKQNKQNIIKLVKTKIKQAEMGLQESFAQMIMWGSANQAGGSLKTPYVSPVNGSKGPEPILELIDPTPTVSSVVGNINQSTATWWRNKVKTSTATTYDQLFLEIEQLLNRASLGIGGKPKLILLDETTYELFTFALYQRYRYTQANVDEAYPFENTTFKGARFVMDDKVPDAYSGVAPTLDAGNGDPASLTYGTAIAINPQFFRLVYEEDSDFVMLKDDSGKSIFKPINQDARVGHFAWMGNLTVMNRRKQAILQKIARTLTVT